MVEMKLYLDKTANWTKSSYIIVYCHGGCGGDDNDGRIVGEIMNFV